MFHRHYKGFKVTGVNKSPGPMFAPGAMIELWRGKVKIKQWPFGITQEACKEYIDRSIELKNGEAAELLVNGVEIRFIRRDSGPTERIEFQAGVRGYAAGSRGDDIAQLSFWPQDRTNPTWEIA